MLAVIARYLLISAVLIAFAPAAWADGEYQHTKDGKTMVWNNEPKPGDEAAWAGARDDEGYATGFGTLTWYTGQKQTVKRLGILPVTKSQIYGRYFGNMVRGKFNGAVNVHANGKTNHAFFIDGVRADRWLAGPAPSRKMPPPRAVIAKQETPTETEPAKSSVAIEPSPAKVASAEEVSAKSADVKEPEAPAEGPIKKADISKKEEVQAQASKLPTPDIPTASTDVVPNNAKRGPSKPALARPKKSQAELEESLSALVGPPSSLHTNVTADGSAIGAGQEETQQSVEARLTKEEVVDLADAEARTRGYSPTGYGRAEAEYNPADQVWSINYKPLDETTGKQRFSITVDDKTKGTVFVQGKAAQ
jgi:hypothetical protein